MQSALPLTFSIGVERDGSTVTVRLAGALDASVAPRVRSQIKPALRDGACTLILDMGAVSYIDQSGVDSLVHAARLAHRLNGRVTLIHCPDQVLRLLAALGHDRLFVQA